MLIPARMTLLWIVALLLPIVPAAAAGAAGDSGSHTLRYSAVMAGGLRTASATEPLVLQPGQDVSRAWLYWWGAPTVNRAEAPIAVTPPNSSAVMVSGGITEAPGTNVGQLAADVTELVRQGGNGTYRVATGGWNLIVAYTSKSEPIRGLKIVDGVGAEAELTLDDGPTWVGWFGYGEQKGTVSNQPVDFGAVVNARSNAQLRVISSTWVGVLFAMTDLSPPELTVTVTAAVEQLPQVGHPIVPGARLELIYTVTASQTGDATGVRLIAPIPAYTTFVSGSGEVTYGQMRVTLGVIPAGGTATATLRLRVNPDAGSQMIRGTAVALYSPRYLPDLTRTAIGSYPQLRITPAANLKLETKLAVSDAWRYTFRVVNIGPSAAFGVVLRDSVHGSLGAPEALPGCEFAGQLMECDLGDLPVGMAVEVTVTLRPGRPPARGVPVTNAVTISGSTLDPDLSDNVRVTSITP